MFEGEVVMSRLTLIYLWLRKQKYDFQSAQKNLR